MLISQLVLAFTASLAFAIPATIDTPAIPVGPPDYLVASNVFTLTSTLDIGNSSSALAKRNVPPLSNKQEYWCGTRWIYVARLCADGWNAYNWHYPNVNHWWFQQQLEFAVDSIEGGRTKWQANSGGWLFDFEMLTQYELLNAVSRDVMKQLVNEAIVASYNYNHDFNGIQLVLYSKGIHEAFMQIIVKPVGTPGYNWWDFKWLWT